MYEHRLIIYNDYVLGRMVAYHEVVESKKEKENFLKYIKNLNEKYLKLGLNVHSFSTPEDTRASIIDYDPYFEGVEFIDSRKEFIDILDKSFKASPIDVAKLILDKIKLSKLYLNNYVHFVNIKYLEKRDELLFEEDAYAYKHGPVYKEIIDVTKKYSSDKIKLSNSDYNYMELRKNQIDDIDLIIDIIDQVIEENKDLSDSECYLKGHDKDSAWYKTFCIDKNEFGKIPKETMYKIHSV